MADEGDLEVKESGGKKKLIIIIVAVVLLIGLGAGGYFLFAGGDEPVSAEGQTSSVKTEEAPSTEPAFYVGMPRPFVFNVQGGGQGRDRLVQIKVQLMVRGEDNEELAKKNIPLIEGKLLNTFSSATVVQLSTPAGKDKLRNEALTASREALKELTGKSVVAKVLFTGFVMQ